MKFVLTKPKLSTGDALTFLDTGEYDFVRFFDNDRVMINAQVERYNGGKRQLTLVSRKDGYFVN